FAEVAVVTVLAKRLAWCVVILINLFFVYFSLIRSITRSAHWQNQYIQACCLQLVVEVFIFETVTTLWVHWVIPRLASRDVNVIIQSLQEIIDSSFSTTAGWNHPLDTPTHFFVSHKLAQSYAHLLEANIVLSFHSYFPPGRMLNHWSSKNRLGTTASNRHGQAQAQSYFSRLLKRMSIAAFVLGLLQTVGTLPMNWQTFMMSLVLPVALVALVFAGQLLISQPVFGIIPIAIVVYLIVTHIRKNREKRKPMEHIVVATDPDSLDKGSHLAVEVGGVSPSALQDTVEVYERQIEEASERAIADCIRSGEAVLREEVDVHNEGDMQLDDASDEEEESSKEESGEEE
ncbi:unnamed protein product, partial [Symbiodinium microadriaticum]